MAVNNHAVELEELKIASRTRSSKDTILHALCDTDRSSSIYPDPRERKKRKNGERHQEIRHNIKKKKVEKQEKNTVGPREDKIATVSAWS